MVTFLRLFQREYKVWLLVYYFRLRAVHFSFLLFLLFIVNVYTQHVSA
jgi:hypothetical protein